MKVNTDKFKTLLETKHGSVKPLLNERATKEMIDNFTFMNLLPYLDLLGMVELSGVIMFIVPKTSKYGTVLLSSYLSGAVAIHLAMMGGQGIFIPFLLGVVVWTGHCLRTYTKD